MTPFRRRGDRIEAGLDATESAVLSMLYEHHEQVRTRGDGAAPDPRRGRLGGATAEAQWRPMLVDAVAKQAVRAGHGLGLSDAILRELAKRQSAPPTEETGQ